MTTAQLLAAALAGLGLGLSLIIAIGAQNAFVLRQGIRRQHVAVVVAICIVSDAVLIGVGVAGAGALFDRAPWLVDVARWLGAAFLVGYGLLAARRAWRPRGMRVEEAGEQAEPLAAASAVAGTAAGAERGVSGRPLPLPGPQSSASAAEARATGRSGLLAAALTTLALTWLNPHVYLDTLVLLGSIASTHGEGRWAFGLGAVLGSVLWFSALGVGARALAPVFARPRAWRILDAVIAVVMVALGLGLVLTPLAG